MKTIAVTALLGVAGTLMAQSAFTGAPYSQNFDTLLSSGTGNAWTQNVTLAGWFWLRSPSSTVGRQAGGWVDVATYNAGNGSSTTGAAYSFGTTGTGERALGTIGSGNAAAGDYVYALVLQNTSGVAMGSFSLNYVGEQWRNGGNTSQAPQTVEFDYAVQSAFATADLNGDVTSGYSVVGSLSFTSPQNGSTAGALDGNVGANRVALSDTVATTWANGDYLILRWFDDNHSGNDHGLAIDDMEFNAHPVPEPATLAVLAGGTLALAVRKRRR